MALLRFLILTIIIINITGCASSSPRFSSSCSAWNDGEEELYDTNAAASDTVSPSLDSTLLMRTISEYLGVPYKHGGESADGIDCSAFTRSVFEKAFMLTLPRSTEEQYRTGKKIRKKNLSRGDLVFFSTAGRTPSHVGIYIGDGLFAHTSVNEGVTISSLSTPYYQQRYIGARRVIE